MRVVKWLDEHFEEAIMILLLVAICCVMMLQIIMRRVFNNSLSWPEEFSRYCYVWTAFMSLSFTIRKGNILRVTVLADLLPHLTKKIIFILINILCLAVFWVFFINSVDVVRTLVTIGQTSTAMRLPMYLVYLCTILGFGFASLRTVQVIYKQVRGFKVVEKTGFEVSKEAALKEAELAKADLEKSQKKAGV